MALTRSKKDGRLYGSAPVILSREIDGRVEYLIGFSTPHGGIEIKDSYKGDRFKEAPHSWWAQEGFTITEAPELAEARRQARGEAQAQVA